MPPTSVKTLRDLLYWQYAKIIAQSAGMGKFQYRFVQERYQKLNRGEIKWDTIREHVKEREKRDVCIYCERSGSDLTQDHLPPKSFGGPQDEKNIVWVCRGCNSRKRDRKLYEWFTIEQGLKKAKYDMPRIAEGKYLKLLFELFNSKGFLDVSSVTPFCGRCSVHKICKVAGTEGKLEVLCLDGVAGLVN